ncbi:hypothetical protein, partial [Streptomyces sp. JV178]|uniref:hypothetical protein n=1 Tax=Streptomyces sp. JV178 TaxID=858632 RepID=UPI001C556959
ATPAAPTTMPTTASTRAVVSLLSAGSAAVSFEVASASFAFFASSDSSEAWASTRAVSASRRPSPVSTRRSS